MKTTIKHTAKAGFTLVELAIVLVIIGLIVGGVLVGQDLIKAAEIRATMADLEEYNAAATTFRNKYGSLPGDVKAPKASQYGLTSRAGTNGRGDGNSLIEGCTAASTGLGCETALFWNDLSDAGLITISFNTSTDASVTSIATTSDMANYLPTTPLRDASFVHVFPTNGRNQYYLGNLQTDATDLTASVDTNIDITNATIPSKGLTPNEAAQIDEKIDDGLPSTGLVRAVSAFQAIRTSDEDPADTTYSCVAPTQVAGNNVYNTADETTAADLLCNIVLRSSF